jgi:hypothetical protein
MNKSTVPNFFLFLVHLWLRRPLLQKKATSPPQEDASPPLLSHERILRHNMMLYETCMLSL